MIFKSQQTRRYDVRSGSINIPIFTICWSGNNLTVSYVFSTFGRVMYVCANVMSRWSVSTTFAARNAIAQVIGKANGLRKRKSSAPSMLNNQAIRALLLSLINHIYLLIDIAQTAEPSIIMETTHFHGFEFLGDSNYKRYILSPRIQLYLISAYS